MLVSDPSVLDVMTEHACRNELLSRVHFEHDFLLKWVRLLNTDATIVVDRLIRENRLCRTVVPANIFFSGATFRVNAKSTIVFVTYPDNYAFSVALRLIPHRSATAPLVFLERTGRVEESIRDETVYFRLSNRKYAYVENTSSYTDTYRSTDRAVLIPIETLETNILAKLYTNDVFTNERKTRRDFCSTHDKAACLQNPNCFFKASRCMMKRESEGPLGRDATDVLNTLSVTVFGQELDKLLPPRLSNENIKYGMGRDRRQPLETELNSDDEEQESFPTKWSMCGVLWAIKRASAAVPPPLRGESFADFRIRYNELKRQHARRAIPLYWSSAWN